MADKKILSIQDGLSGNLPDITTAKAGRILITTDRGEMYYEPEDKKRIQVNPQADWTQNDETANDYVKNRPGGYIEWKQVYRGSLNGTFETVNQTLSLGKNWKKKYKVIFDGVEYICTVKDYDDYIYLGNLKLLFSAGTDETEPFLILDLYDKFEMYASTDAAHSIKIFIEEEIVKIPESYLEINNTNLVNGSSTGSLRTTGSFGENPSYTMGQYAFAEGDHTKASGNQSHAEGYYTTASSYASHAEGDHTKALGNYSHAEGNSTTASGDHQHVQGKYNIEDSSNTYADIIGNGSSYHKRSNAATVDWNGNAWYAGDVYVGSTSGTNKDEGSKKLATEDYVNTTISAGGGSGIVVDSELSDTSENPVQNKVIKAHMDSITISDIASIRSNAANGQTAYEMLNGVEALLSNI